MILDNFFLVDRKYYKKSLKRKSNIFEIISALEEYSIYNRINTLTAIYKAQHGWLGASFSIADILTVIYFYLAKIEGVYKFNDFDYTLLSKGHATIIQYACLAGLGIIPTKSLLNYKTPNGPQAHTDISTKGIYINSGSLGQTLSKATGIALANSKSKIFVILGDGELQEGQNYEALMTIKQYKLFNVIPIIDCNRIQSDSNVDDIKKIYDLGYVLRGFGFDVLEVDGHNYDELILKLSKIYNTQEKNQIMIAYTEKGAGVSFMSASAAKRRKYIWHSAIPDKIQYLEALEELKQKIKNEKIFLELTTFIKLEKQKLSEPKEKPQSKKEYSTGEYFSKTITELAKKNKNIYCIDADLEKSCKLTEFALNFSHRFIEVGIAEQDMISIAGGLALSGKLPIVNTYANFYRRGFEQIYVNATENTRVIYAGHYSGLCYTTDGKTHQATGDVAMFRSIPNMLVFYPTFNFEIPQILNWYLIEKIQAPIYFKLHRTAPLVNFFGKLNIAFNYGFGNKIIDNNSEVCVLTSGPQLINFCGAALDKLKKKNKISADLFAVSTLKNLDIKFVNEITDKYKKIFFIEELIDCAGLFDEFMKKLASQDNPEKLPQIYYRAVNDFTFCTLDRIALYKYFKLDTDNIFLELLKQKINE